jgi:hypothetical protein
MVRAVFAFVILATTTAACGAFLGSSGDDDPAPGGGTGDSGDEGSIGNDASTAEGGAQGGDGSADSAADGATPGKWSCPVECDQSFIGPFVSLKACQLDQEANNCLEPSASEPCTVGEGKRIACQACTLTPESATEHHYAARGCSCVPGP